MENMLRIFLGRGAGGIIPGDVMGGGGKIEKGKEKWGNWKGKGVILRKDQGRKRKDKRKIYVKGLSIRRSGKNTDIKGASAVILAVREQ